MIGRSRLANQSFGQPLLSIGRYAFGPENEGVSNLRRGSEAALAILAQGPVAPSGQVIESFGIGTGVVLEQSTFVPPVDG